jgi:Mrp family chromosome partitioning ATPase
MEQIRQAVERAKAGERGRPPSFAAAPAEPPPPAAAPPRTPEPPPRAAAAPPPAPPRPAAIREVALDRRQLEANRVISHDIADVRCKAFDLLRTQVLQSMDRNNWQFLAVTSPTPGCGKTVTAVNLALSIARQPERSALLVDLDLQRPRVAGVLGLRCDTGVLDVLERHAALPEAMLAARIGQQRLLVLPAEAPTAGSSEWIASRAMQDMLREIKRDFRSRIVILDMPPMLTSDDVLALLPQVDCVLLVAAVGTTTLAEIDECNSHLHSTDVVRLVLNKVPGLSRKYY